MLLADLRDKGVVVHLISLCEMFLSRSSMALDAIENYVPIHRPRSGLGGSISLYLHSSVKLIREFDCPFNEAFESCAVEVQLKSKSIFFAEFYQIPNSNDKLGLESLKKLIKMGNSEAN